MSGILTRSVMSEVLKEHSKICNTSVLWGEDICPQLFALLLVISYTYHRIFKLTFLFGPRKCLSTILPELGS